MARTRQHTRRAVLASAALTIGFSVFGASGALAQSYPSRTVTIIVPFTPGGGTDVLGRAIAQKLSESWKQPVIVENRVGAGGNIGAARVAKAAPDGYTLLMAPNSLLTINHLLYDNMTFDPVKDFAPIATLVSGSLLLVTNPSLPFQSVSDLMARAKKEPGSINFGSAGHGSPQHLSAEMFASMADLKLQHIPYKGSPPLLTDLLSSKLHIAFVPLPSALPSVRAGKLRALAVTTQKRLPNLPDVPTIAESGLTGYESVTWQALVAPAGTPKDIVMQVNAALLEVFSLPDLRDMLSKTGQDPATGSPEELAARIKSDSAKWAAVIKKLPAPPQ